MLSIEPSDYFPREVHPYWPHTAGTSPPDGGSQT